jgi:hypothetical protein
MAVSPLVSLFLMMGICAVFLALLFPPLGEVLGMGMNLIYLPIEEMVYLFARIPVLKIGDTKGTILIVAAVILIYGGLLLLRAAKRKKVYVRFARL